MLSNSATLPKGEWKPKQKCYDFLSMMDHDRAIRGSSSKSSEIETAEEHGIGNKIIVKNLKLAHWYILPNNPEIVVADYLELNNILDSINSM